MGKQEAEKQRGGNKSCQLLVGQPWEMINADADACMYWKSKRGVLTPCRGAWQDLDGMVEKPSTRNNGGVDEQSSVTRRTSWLSGTPMGKEMKRNHQMGVNYTHWIRLEHGMEMAHRDAN